MGDILTVSEYGTNQHDSEQVDHRILVEHFDEQLFEGESVGQAVSLDKFVEQLVSGEVEVEAGLVSPIEVVGQAVEVGLPEYHLEPPDAAENCQGDGSEQLVAVGEHGPAVFECGLQVVPDSAQLAERGQRGLGVPGRVPKWVVCIHYKYSFFGGHVDQRLVVPLPKAYLAL
jgi:hypothetical protein